ncbi:hypothetical protein [Flavobacterium sp.]
MKKSYVLFVLCSVLFFSCQRESETITLDSDNSFTTAAPLSSLIKRVAQYATSNDNVLDNTSCFGIKLPVAVTVNSQSILVSSVAGYTTIQDIKNQYTTDDDVVYFTFPTTIIYPDFHEVSVANQTQFAAILAGCGNDSGFKEIECIDFDFPFSINVYNSNNQVASSISIKNNIQLYNFIQNVTEGVIIGIAFPITITESNGDNHVINSNLQLETEINDSINDCGTTTPIPLILSDVLTSGSWYVSYFYDSSDETNHYNGYVFNFNTNGFSFAVKNTNTINGTWQIHTETNYQKIEFHFDGSVLEEIEKDWKVIEFTNTVIRLKHESSSGNDNHYLNFTKN